MAATAIACLPMTEACYVDAMSMLKERFGDKTMIIQQHLTALRNLLKVTSANDIHGLRRFYGATQLNIRCLEALNVPTLAYSATFGDILLQALLRDIGFSFTREKRRHTLTQPSDVSAARTSSSSAPADAAAAFDAELNDLLLFMRLELERREQCASPSPSPATDDRNDEMNGGVSTPLVMHIASIARSQCFYSRTNQHGTRSCYAVIHFEFKKEQLRKGNWCFRCTSKGNRTKECRVKLTCSLCRGRHASSMCSPNYKKTSTTAGTSGYASNAVSTCEDVLSTHQPPTDNAVYLQIFSTELIDNDRSTCSAPVVVGAPRRGNNFTRCLAPP
ncbi:hypothetical protein HPB51_006198 [Rhipicephalus microplus]|uniref:Tick transposon n=1 Tax=Rhipicephalus microplus TaxID=6941 RepID=A0A9J6D4V2_RHIMP|nr:hypothetical protein HPB51_006198 [Rhipicephalus microplus]